MLIALDTNFLIDLMRYHVEFEIEKKSELFTTTSVINELKAIARKKTKESKYAKLALNWIEQNQVKIVKVGKKADDELVSLAKQNFIIATNDRKLRKKIKTLGGKTIYLRSRKKIAIG